MPQDRPKYKNKYRNFAAMIKYQNNAYENGDGDAAVELIRRIICEPFGSNRYIEFGRQHPELFSEEPHVPKVHKKSELIRRLTDKEDLQMPGGSGLSDIEYEMGLLILAISELLEAGDTSIQFATLIFFGDDLDGGGYPEGELGVRLRNTPTGSTLEVGGHNYLVLAQFDDENGGKNTAIVLAAAIDLNA